MNDPAGLSEKTSAYSTGIGILATRTISTSSLRPAGFMKQFNPKAVTTKKPKGPRTKGALPRYVAIGNARKVASSKWLISGRVSADFDAAGELIGVEILG